eukprot:TRINITY_DN8068_c2_g1_i1.p1 TRINITY_DN8068_c2_g1~~TRINITY_DN8068_c2_g1_i1.p1  ORF type:complete len:214 (+),score=20.58 TRINITY_DN8068_c2_g1_i1:110-751(+)
MRHLMSIMLFFALILTICSAVHLDDGRVLQESGEYSCDKDNCIFRNEYGEDLEIYEGTFRLKVMYDAGGPYLAMNMTIEGTGSVKDVRYAVSIRQTDYKDEIIYKGDHGYDFCCRFIHDIACSWKGKSLTPDTTCSLETFTGSVAKPLHHHQDGPWSAKIIFNSRGEELGFIEFPFVVTLKDLGSIVSLKKIWESPYGHLVIAAPKNKTSETE